MDKLTSLVPLPYRLLAIALLAVVLIGFGWAKGVGHVRSTGRARARSPGRGNGQGGHAVR